MNYQKHYDLLIDKAKNRLFESDQYREKHHVIPKCMGGGDEPENIIELTPEEHYVAHQLLVKMYPNHKGLIWAAVKMTGHSKVDDRSKNKMYGWLRRKNSEMARQRNKERYKNPEYKEKMVRAAKKRWKNPEYREKMSKLSTESNKEMWKDPEYREKMSKASKEYWSDPENRKKHSENRKGKKNGSCGTHWYHHPETLNTAKCKPEDKPEDYVLGKKPNNKCIVCSADTGNKLRKYCDDHRKEQKTMQAKKRKPNISDEQIIEAIPLSVGLRDTCRNMGMKDGSIGGKICKRIQSIKDQHNLKFKKE